MQKKIRFRKRHRQTRLELLKTLWDKTLGDIHADNCMIKDKKTQDIIMGIGAVQTKVKEYALEKFLEAAV
jgi:hypothetical protein